MGLAEDGKDVEMACCGNNFGYRTSLSISNDGTVKVVEVLY